MCSSPTAATAAAAATAMASSRGQEGRGMAAAAGARAGVLLSRSSGLLEEVAEALLFEARCPFLHEKSAQKHHLKLKKQLGETEKGTVCQPHRRSGKEMNSAHTRTAKKTHEDDTGERN